MAVSAGWSHTCALTAGGGVKCWGSNGNGQLGDGTTTDSTIPVDVVGLGSGVIAISAGAGHTCAITTGGGAKCWGGNDWGGLGNGTKNPSVTPVDVSGLASGVAAISAGLIHTCALTTGGGLKCWGYNSFGGLGNGLRMESLIPVDVIGLTRGATAVATGYEHSCALTTVGAVKCWGSGNGSAIGNGSNMFRPVQTQVTGLESGVVAITAGPDHACAARDLGDIKCWGGNYGNLPVDVGGGGSDGISMLAGGSGHTCALTSLGVVTCWGANHYGQHGNGSTRETVGRDNVVGLPGGVTAIDAGYDHTCALTVSGEVKCWGDNWTGQLGNGRPCDSMGSATTAVDVAFTGLPGGKPAPLPSGPIEHAMGPKDVVLRFDVGPDLEVGDLAGELFQPGPEFTLYGDGTAIFRDNNADLPMEGPILRARPFTIAHLTEDQVQELLQFAIGEGGLAAACETYESRDIDGFGSTVYTVHTSLLDKRIEAFGEDPLRPLVERLRNLGRGGSIPTSFWSPDRFRGSLFVVDPENYSGVLPDPDEVGNFAWPWPGIAPDDFVRPPGPAFGTPRRVMSAAEAAVHGFSNNGGLVKRVYLYGPDRKTLYYFSMWPIFPDETS